MTSFFLKVTDGFGGGGPPRGWGGCWAKAPGKVLKGFFDKNCSDPGVTDPLGGGVLTGWFFSGSDCVVFSLKVTRPPGVTKPRSDLNTTDVHQYNIDIY